MKSFNYSKKLSDHHIAHLYEHIFFIHLDTRLRDEGFVAPLDYELDATTKAGVIHVSLDVYNKDILNGIAPDVCTELPIDFEMEVTEIALHQVSSEYGRALAVRTPSTLFEVLRKVHEFPWSCDETLTVSEVLSVGEPVKLSELTISYDLNKVEKELLPLYRQITGILMNVVSSDIADTYGGYINTEAYRVNESQKLYSTIQFLASFDQSEVDVRTITRSAIKELLQNGAFDRLAAMLNNIEQTEHAPSVEQTRLATGITMTPKSWRQTATKENIDMLINMANDSIETGTI